MLIPTHSLALPLLPSLPRAVPSLLPLSPLQVVFRRHKTKFVTGQNYAGWQSIVKSTYFAVAMLKLEKIDEYYNFLQSDDALEQFFGILRLLVSSCRGFDLLQLEDRISAACQIKEIFERHPDWDRTSRKLNKSFDHWNTRSWTGCTKTSIVNLGRCWEMGANAAKVVLRRHNLYSEEEVDFEGISGDGDIDLMRPNGVLVGLSEVEQ